MYLRGRRIGWHALNVRFEFFNLPPIRISPLSSKNRDSDKISLEAYNFLISAWYSWENARCCTVLQIQFKTIDISTGDTKVDTACSWCALDNLKQYAMLRHILFKLEYLFSRRWCKDGKWKRLRGFSFVREDHCLNAWRLWAASVLHPILEIQGHSITS